MPKPFIINQIYNSVKYEIMIIINYVGTTTTAPILLYSLKMLFKSYGSALQL